MYEDLYAAIVFQQILDYTYARDYMSRHKKKYESLKKKRKRGEPLPDKQEIFYKEYGLQRRRYKRAILFFRSQDCFLLCGIDGELIMKELECVSYKEVRERTQIK